MSASEPRRNEDPGQEQPRRVRLPGFVIETEIGLGDVIQGVTYAVGIKSCGGCDRRAATLNRWVVFSR